MVVAHPDDEVLGAGGTIARLAAQGADVTVLILGEGGTSRYSRREAADPGIVATLANQARECTRILGARECVCSGLPDNRFDTVPLLDVVKIIEEWVQRVQPNCVYSHHSGDLNVDHAVVAQATLTATRPVAGCSVKELYAFEVPSSTEWSFQRGALRFAPNVFVDISDTLEIKKVAFEVYKDEIRPFPHPRSLKALEAAAVRWGSVVGVNAAEAFELVRSVR